MANIRIFDLKNGEVKKINFFTSLAHAESVDAYPVELHGCGPGIKGRDRRDSRTGAEAPVACGPCALQQTEASNTDIKGLLRGNTGDQEVNNFPQLNSFLSKEQKALQLLLHLM